LARIKRKCLCTDQCVPGGSVKDSVEPLELDPPLGLLLDLLLLINRR
jgi:hypothetical protein